MKKGFDRLRGVAAASAMGLGSGLLLDTSLDDTDNDGVINGSDAFPNDASRSVAASSSSSGATGLPLLFALLGVPALLRRFRKDK